MSLESESRKEMQCSELHADSESAPNSTVHPSMRESGERLASHTDSSLATVVVKSEPEEAHEKAVSKSGSTGHDKSSSCASRVKHERDRGEELEPRVYFPASVKMEPGTRSPGDPADEDGTARSRRPTVVMQGENFYVEMDPDFEAESSRWTGAELEGREGELDEGEMLTASRPSVSAIKRQDSAKLESMEREPDKREMVAAGVPSVSAIKHKGSAGCESAWHRDEDGVPTDVNMMHASYGDDGIGRKARRKGTRSRRKGGLSAPGQSSDSTNSHSSWANIDSVLNGTRQPCSSAVGSSPWAGEESVLNGKGSPPLAHGVHSPLQDCQEHSLASGSLNDSEDSWDFSGGGGKLYCLECKMDFDRMSDFEQHVETVHGKERRFGCPDCGRRFSRRNHLNRHVEVLHGEGKKYSCPECLKKFSSKEYLKTHLSSVHGEEKAYTCTECGKRFGWKSYLKLHMETIHAGEKKYACSLCKKRFGWKSHLLTHMEVIHENQRKHSCPRCGRRFSSKAYLKTHLFTVHENEETHAAEEGGEGGDQGSKKTDWEAEQASESRYSCQRCDRTFTLRSNLTRHMKTVHGGEKKYQCPDCGKQFGQKSNLDTHVKTVHSGLKEFVCPDCGKEFTVKRSLKIHCAIVHRGRQMQSCT